MGYETPGDGSNYPGFGDSRFKDKRLTKGYEEMEKIMELEDVYRCKTCDGTTHIIRKRSENRQPSYDVISSCRCGCTLGVRFWYTREIP